MWFAPRRVDLREGRLPRPVASRACVDLPFRFLSSRSPTRFFGRASVTICFGSSRLSSGRRWFLRRAFGFAMEDQADILPDNAVAIDDSAADRQELDRVTRAISSLPANLKEPLVLRTIEGLSQAETAEVLGISQKAVETRLYRARARLMEKLNVG